MLCSLGNKREKKLKKISGAEEGEEVDDGGDIGAFHDSVADIVCFGWSCRACQKYVCINCEKTAKPHRVSE